MRALIQRVKTAKVLVEEQIIGQIDKGLCVFIGLGGDDDESDILYLRKKILNLRVFPNESGLFDKCVKDVDGSMLLISQFTLYGNSKKGNRPSFSRSMPVSQAKEFFERVIDLFREEYEQIQTGMFGAKMEVSLINDGPVTLMIDSKNRDY